MKQRNEARRLELFNCLFKKETLDSLLLCDYTCAEMKDLWNLVLCLQSIAPPGIAIPQIGGATVIPQLGLSLGHSPTLGMSLGHSPTLMSLQTCNLF